MVRPDLDPETDPLFNFGWLPKDLPQLDEDEPVLPRGAVRRGDGVRVERTDLTVIAALLYAMEGDGVHWAGSPDYVGSDELAERLSEHLGDYGISKRTLQDRFAAARKRIPSPGRKPKPKR